ncbi:helix-turn-helix domain-containing protein [Nocardia sp. NPDC057668]|uniref:helix-turn-helix domain-containing protein n=1 Tax=Nocardia sp. NPDC057668 TaxID=3346202 RepID=UPI00366DBCDA
MNTWFPRTPEADALVAEERLVLAATEMVHEALHETGTTKKQLADKLGVRPTEISQRLSGRRNLTLRSLAQMMHALGYGVALNSADPIDMDAAASRIGLRVVSETELSENRSRSWDVGFRVQMKHDGSDHGDFIKRRVDAIVNELRTLDRIREVAVSYPDDVAVQVQLSVESEDVLTASQIGITALRTAIHSVGDRTPGWEKQIERMLRDLRISIGSADHSEETTTCG